GPRGQEADRRLRSRRRISRHGNVLIVRSPLFVPGHAERKVAKGLDCAADALIVDLEDSVPDAENQRARGVCAEFVAANRERLPLFVRINALASGLAAEGLASG